MPDLLVRPAGAADLAALTALLAELHPDDPALPAEVAARTWRAIEAQPGRAVLVAERDGRLAGTVDCIVVPNLTRAARPFMLVENVVVGAAHRRAGVGSALFAAVVAVARDSGCYKIQLMSAAQRGPAHSFYVACGFTASAQGFRRYL